MTIYPGWLEGTPSTDKAAKVNKFRDVSNVRVLKVSKASFRNAIFDGIFELEDQDKHVDPIRSYPSGKIKVTVICSWYGCTADTTYPHIDLSGAASYKLIENYSGEVADNIGK